MKEAVAPAVDTRLYAFVYRLFCGRCNAERGYKMVQFYSKCGHVCYKCPKCSAKVHVPVAEAPLKGAAAQ